MRFAAPLRREDDGALGDRIRRDQPLQFARRTRRAEQKRIGKRCELVVEHDRFADFVDEAEMQGLRRRESFARQSVAAQHARAERARKERRKARHHAEPHFGNRKEGALGREEHIAAGGESQSAADATALDNGDRRLWQRVNRDQCIVQRKMRFGFVFGRLAGHRRDIGTDAEMLAIRAQNDDPHGGLGRPVGELLAELVEHDLVEGIAAVRPIERDGRDAAR